jgi:hypothetical protein
MSGEGEISDLSFKKCCEAKLKGGRKELTKDSDDVISSSPKDHREAVSRVILCRGAGKTFPSSNHPPHPDTAPETLSSRQFQYGARPRANPFELAPTSKDPSKDQGSNFKGGLGYIQRFLSAKFSNSFYIFYPK